MQKNAKRIILLLLTLGWMLTIFLFSAKPASESMQQSDGIVERLVRIFVPDFDSLSAEQQDSITHTLSMVVRKGAHMAEYAVLAILLYALLSSWNASGRAFLCIVYAWGGATLYAVTDELHQRFVPGRSGKPIDVLIDSVGALAGVAIAVGVLFLVNRRKQRKAGCKKSTHQPEQISQ
ncbi:MAG: VanZ family protein [Clostridia bacterium]|nr:VanZ family protein [Clostridia bacterium]